MQFFYSDPQPMQPSRPRRQLRHNAACSPHSNFFKNEQYVLKSGSQHLPEDIYEQVSKLNTLTCDDINSLTFRPQESHSNVMTRMDEALRLQRKEMEDEGNRQDAGSQWRGHAHGMDESMREIRIIKSEQYEQEEILNNPCFKNDLQNLFLH